MSKSKFKEMERIEAYRTFDGKVFGTREKAEQHERRVRENVKLKELIHQLYTENLTAYDLADKLIEEKEQLRQILLNREEWDLEE